jgi:hypothetical protein
LKTTDTTLDAEAVERVPRSGLCALAVMTKAPRAGAVKTRLVPPLKPEEAAALSVCFLRDTTENIARVVRDGGNARGVAVYTPLGAEAAYEGLLPRGFAMLAQRGEGFGERLFHAVEDLLAVGFASLCLIDSDSPTLPHATLARAVAALARPGDRTVLGPSDDGGYYLVGLKGAHRRLFEDIEWSTDRVFTQTVERAAEINLDVETLPAWYDVDDAVTLQRLHAELFPPPPQTDVDGSASDGYDAPHTRRYLARLIDGEARVRVLGSDERATRGEAT